MKKLLFSFPTISASVSCMNLLNMEQQIKEVESAGVSFFHYDVVDGRFNRCFILGDSLLEQMSEKTSLPIEVHLAIYHPEQFIERFAKSGADYIAVQYEALDHPFHTFDLIRKYNANPVLCYKSTTAPDSHFLSLAKEVSWILKLTVHPGFSGQRIQPNAVSHIQQMARLLKEANIQTPIQADGNVNLSTISELASAGASIFTGGSSGLFDTRHTISQNVHALRKKILF